MGSRTEGERRGASYEPSLEWHILAHAPGGVIFVDRDWRYRFINPVADELHAKLGLSHDDLLGRSIWDAFPHLVGTEYEEAARRAMYDRVPTDCVRPDPAAAHRVFEIRFVPTELGLIVFTRDVTERHRLEGARYVLAEAGRVLAARLDIDETLVSLTSLLVPRFADWCFVDLREGEGFRRRAVTHADPSRASVARDLARYHPERRNARYGSWRAIGAHQPQLLDEGGEELIARLVRGGETADVLRALAPIHSYLCVPLVARDRALGALTMMQTDSGRHFAADDLALAEELARRLALAIDNAALFAREQSARLVAEAAVARTSRLQELTAALSTTLTESEVASVVLEQGLATLGAEAGAVALLDESGLELRILRAVGYEERVVARFERMPLDARVPLADAVRSAAPVIQRNIAERGAAYPHLAEARRALGSGALAALPLVVDGRPIGAIGLNFSESRPLVQEDAAFLLALAQQCASALERARLHDANLRALEEASQARLGQLALIESITDGFAEIDADWRFSYVNGKACEIFARRAEDVVGRPVWEVFRGAEAAPLSRVAREASETGEARHGESESAARPGWLEYHIYPTARGLSFFFRDITERKRAETAAAFLTEASALLVSSLDYRETLANLAALVVPRIASGCSIDLFDDENQLQRVATVEDDPDRERAVAELAARRPVSELMEHPIHRVVATGEPYFEQRIERAGHIPATVGADGDLLQSTGWDSVIIVPLRARGRTLGAMTMGTVATRAPLTRQDLAMANDLAQRAAVAVENARLHFAEQLARTEAEAANRAKTDFLAAMSHELRTPLNAIRGYAQLLELGVRGPVTPAQVEDLRRIRRSEEHLLSIINDILNMARLEAGALEYRIESLAVDPMLREVEAMSAPQVLAKGLRYEYLAADGDLRVLADADRVRQIVVNLVSNAIKFTEAGGSIVLRCGCDESKVAIEVADTGRGIPANRLDDIFEPFVQINRTLRQPTEGAGLGLAISRQLARAMSGDLVVSSTPSEGSVFRLSLPRG